MSDVTEKDLKRSGPGIKPYRDLVVNRTDLLVVYKRFQKKIIIALKNAWLPLHFILCNGSRDKPIQHVIIF